MSVESRNTFGQPFRFGQALEFNRGPPPYLKGFHGATQSTKSWLCHHKESPPVRQATVTAHSRMPSSSNVSSPACVTISKEPITKSSDPDKFALLLRKMRSGLSTPASCIAGDSVQHSAGRSIMSASKQPAMSDDGSTCEESTPGPGQYEVRQSFGKGPSFSIGTRMPAIPTTSADAPGPGAYLAHADVTAGPAFTMKGRLYTDTARSQSPGPGMYHCESRQKGGPAWSFASRLETHTRPVSPGPGAYQVASSRAAGPAFTIGGRPASGFLQLCDMSPGPADYQPAAIGDSSGPVFSIESRWDKQPRSTSPAPGDYEVAPHWRTGPAYSISHRPSPTALEAPEWSPGPGDYHSENSNVGGPAWSIAGRLGETSKAEQKPGPAEYHRDVQPCGPAYSIQGRYKELQLHTDGPGPGAYLPGQAEAGTGPAYSFPKGGIAESEQPATPGPGQYDLYGRPHKGPAFTMAARTPAPGEAEPQSPGPAQYNLLHTTPGGPAFTMGVLTPTNRERDCSSPAPGDYELASYGCKTGPTFSIAGKPVQTTGDAADLPGPGQYEPPTMELGPAFSIGAKPASTADQPKPDGPGPGHYSIHNPFSSPAFTFAGKTEELPRLSSPGPGAYQAPATCRGPAFTIPGKGVRHHTPENLVGPGQYDPQTPAAGPAFSIGTRALGGDSDCEPTPGPGAYSSMIEPSGSGPAWTMGAKHEPDPKAVWCQLGPGAYEVHGSKTGPAFTIGQKPPEPERPASPGPGEYHRPAPRTVGPAFSMAGCTEHTPAAPDTPSPSEYEVPSSFAGPAFTMAGRTGGGMGLARDTGPGPGEYHHEINGSSPAVTMLGRTKASTTADDSPGPGEYNITQSMQTGPAFSLVGRTADAGPCSESPGPTQYKLPAPDAGPAPTMGKKLSTSNPVADLPAPGDYYQSHSPGNKSAPAYTLAALPTKKATDPTPGPGEYTTLISTPTGPAFTMLGKCRTKKKKQRHIGSATPRSPGSCHYQPSMAGLLPASPAFTMSGKLANFVLPLHSVIGPGEHQDVRASQTDSSYRMGCRPHSGVVDKTPGPGHYDNMRPFSRPLGDVVSYFLRPLHGVDGASGSSQQRPASRRVTFSASTKFAKGELAACTAGRH